MVVAGIVRGVAVRGAAGRQARFACPGRGCRDGLRPGPAYQASLNAGPSSPTSDRLRLVSRSPSYPSQEQAMLILNPSSRPVGQTGGGAGWSRLAWTQVPRRGTPLPVAGKAGVSLGPTASLEGGGSGALHLCSSVAKIPLVSYPARRYNRGDRRREPKVGRMSFIYLVVIIT